MDIASTVIEHKLMLGGSRVNIEISDADIEALVMKAYRLIKPKVSQKTFITVPYAPCIDLSSYHVLDVLRCLSANMNYSTNGTEILFDFEAYTQRTNPMNPVQSIQNSLYTNANIGFEFYDGNLYLGQACGYNWITAECIVDIQDITALEDERAIAWIESYSLALCKEVLGRIRAKYRPANSPVENDGETLLQEAQQEKSELMSELNDRDYGPFFILT